MHVTAPGNVEGVPPTIGQVILARAAVSALGIPPNGAVAIDTRIRLLLRLGLRRSGERSPGRGRVHRNELHDALEAVLALQLQRTFAPPTAVVSFILDNRERLDHAWARAARGEPAEIEMRIDALSKAGRSGMRMGRFSEDAVETISFAAAHACGEAVPPPTIGVDLRHVYQLTIANLRRAGARADALARSEARVAAGDTERGGTQLE